MRHMIFSDNVIHHYFTPPTMQYTLIVAIDGDSINEM